MFMILIGIFSCSGSSSKTEYVNLPDYVELKVGQNTTKEELRGIANNLKNRGIHLKYTNTTYAFFGGIKRVDLEITTDDGYYAHIIGDFSRFNEYYGFYRDYREKARTPFYYGKMSVLTLNDCISCFTHFC